MATSEQLYAAADRWEAMGERYAEMAEHDSVYRQSADDCFEQADALRHEALLAENDEQEGTTP